MATSQHRCVFVGNIPYDATEEQLIQICEEVGPVVSFRLVIDRESGKPKGYGFCEYKDEETALSARRNLQGYEINGRQLRVDFAENDKNSDRNREQGRAGPGMVANADLQKQLGGPAIIGDSGFDQPIGLQVAMPAASVMAGTLGGVQVSREFSQNGLQGQPVLISDPLTLHLAKMSRNQLNEVMSELKVIATQNKEQARQLLLACPQLPKALFQAEIMLGMVTPKMLQTSNIRQASGLPGQPLSQDGQQSQQPSGPNFPGLPPLAQNRMQIGVMPRVQEAQPSSVHMKSLTHQPQSQLPQPAQNQILEQRPVPAQSGISTGPSMRPALSDMHLRQLMPGATSSSMKQQIQLPFFQQRGQVGAANIGHNSQQVTPNALFQPPLSTRPPLPDQNFQSGASPSGIPPMINKDVVNVPISVSRQSQVSSIASSVNQIPQAEVARNSEKQVPQVQLPPEMESALLQQVLSLTPEQLSSLPPDQQQQVIQLQRMLR